MSKKLIVSLSIVLCLVAVVLVLFWTLFALSSVSVEFHSTKHNLTLSDADIVEAGEFRYGASVLFEGKNKSIKRINAKASENPNFAYLRVVNIETVFPNKFVIHVTEREELFAVEHDGQVLICDRDFRVLRIENEFERARSNAITLKGLSILDADISVGDFLNIAQEGMKKFYSAMLENNRSLGEMIGKFKEITLSEYQDDITKSEYVSMNMTTFGGRKFVINNIDFALTEKIQKMFAVEAALFEQSSEELANIKVVKNERGEYLSYQYAKDLTDNEGNKLYTENDFVSLTHSILARCYVKVDNFTLSEHVERSEKDIFYALVEE